MNLLKRVLTAAVLLPLAILVINTGGWLFSFFIILIGVVCVDEIERMIVKSSLFVRLVFSVATAMLMSGLLARLDGFLVMSGISLVCSLALIWATFRPQMTAQELARVATFLLVALYVVFGLCALALLPVSILYVMLIAVWSNDTFAYLTGRAMGRHPMMPLVSAKKTWEGFIGGALGSVGLVVGLWWWLHDFLPFSALSLTDATVIALACVVLGPLGDLVESRIKRLFEVKDSGNLLPGHGGVFDRIDALLLMAPFTSAYVFLIRPWLM